MPENGHKGPPRVGGQAIIEGVMMRSPDRLSAAVRLPNGEIVRKIWESRAWFRRHRLLGWPLVRGAVSMAEALVLGLRTLNWSAEVAMEAERGAEASTQARKRDALGLAASMAVAVLLALGLFMWLPYQLAEWAQAQRNQALFHLVAGSARITFFLVYLALISRLKDVRRLFEYHGAEHQSIFSYEKGEGLDPEAVRRQSRFHPRCGTSFLLIVALVVMAVFVLFDVLVTTLWGAYPNALVRLLVHLPFLPLVAGVSYEFLRFSDRFSDRAVFRVLISPGLALQRLTTRPPDDSQREVAVEALKSALDPAAVPPALGRRGA
ncbi:MAG: DUF1385 domain-containing protein [Candidatus Zixiibacteriota bacterium]|nr:MAG: DUF1385 domain-containing protein [candidate division Zixibacteria bacterium]